MASAPGKLVLTGEYVVLEGAPALVAAMDRRAHVQLTPSDHFAARAFGDSVALAPARPGAPPTCLPSAEAAAPRWAVLQAALAAVAAHVAAHGATLSPCHLELTSDAFDLAPGGPKLGLGASAAVCVALCAALLAHAGLLADVDTPAARAALFAVALAAHRAAQGGGSGVDVAASVYGGILRFQLPRAGPPPPAGTSALPHVAPVALLPRLSLLPVWAGAPASTAALLARVAACKAATPQRYWAACEPLGVHAHAAAEFWALGNVAALLSVVDAADAALRGLGSACDADIVTASHRSIGALARGAGAHYKPSGAGGGDLGLAFCGSRAIARRARTRLARAGHRVVDLVVDLHGVRCQPA